MRNRIANHSSPTFSDMAFYTGNDVSDRNKKCEMLTQGSEILVSGILNKLARGIFFLLMTEGVVTRNSSVMSF